MPYRIPKPRTKAITFQPFEKLLGTQQKEEPPYGKPPEDWTGSLAEWAVAWALEALGEEYMYQVPFGGGRLQTGGQVLDFVIPSRNVVIRVQGFYWHYQLTGATGHDEIEKLQLEAAGYVVVDIDEEDALTNPMYYVKEALEGRSHARTEMGV